MGRNRIDLNPIIVMIILNIHGLNIIVKKVRVDGETRFSCQFRRKAV